MNGHRIALLRQFAEEDPRKAMRVYGESIAFAGLIRGLEDYRKSGRLGEPPDPDRFEAYEQTSRAMLRADDLAAAEPEQEEESITFQ